MFVIDGGYSRCNWLETNAKVHHDHHQKAKANDHHRRGSDDSQLNTKLSLFVHNNENQRVKGVSLKIGGTHSLNCPPANGMVIVGDCDYFDFLWVSGLMGMVTKQPAYKGFAMLRRPQGDRRPDRELENPMIGDQMCSLRSTSL